ncbi:hypothetical protein HispidOSU_013870 [Sigmodon hispidus]
MLLGCNLMQGVHLAPSSRSAVLVSRTMTGERGGNVSDCSKDMTLSGFSMRLTALCFCSSGLLTIAAPAVSLEVAVAPWRFYTSATVLHPAWTPPVLHLSTVSQRPNKDSPVPRSSEVKAVQLNPGGGDSDTQVQGGARNQQYLVCGAWLHPPSLATCFLELEDKNQEAGTQPAEPQHKVRGLLGAEATTSCVPDCLNRFYFLILSVYSIDQRANLF